MSIINIIRNYINNIKKGYESGIYTEHSYRNELIDLIKSIINDNDIIITNEPKRQKCGAPDYIINRKNITIGYIEVKDVGVDLKTIENAEQINRYKKSLDNLILSNYFDFIFYRNGEKIEEISLATIEKNKIKENLNNFQIFEKYVIDFCNYRGITIKSSEDLAKIMARKTSFMKDIIYNALKDEEDNSLKDQFKVFKEILIHDLSEESFADTYAQTIDYGLFSARLHDKTKDSFSREKALFLIPKSNPFLRQLFTYIAGPDLDERVVWIINDLCEIFKSADLNELLINFGNSTGQNDPFLHFYETFLSEYNPELRKSRGVYYTPQPIVNFIVRTVNDILKKEFNIQKGLADNSKIKLKVDKENKEFHRVQILDPAAGTGTFLAEIVKEIYKDFCGQEGIWSDYVEKHLIPRLNGFEILMASYTVCHIKLEMLLKEYGYEPKDENKPPRLKIFLTNSLEEAHQYSGTLLTSWLAKETTEANKVKQENPVMVVIGNPPYSGVSSNMGEWISNLIEEYKYVNGEYFNEKKHWLHDDYVKFIRLGEYFINKNKEGILAYINNHSFLDNPTFRGMRWHLLKTFDKIYIIDLHGNAKKKERAPDGTIDENVFDIQQGVSINIFIKSGKKKDNELGKVYYYELYGEREYKYKFLLNNSLDSIEFKEVKYSEPFYFFTPKDFTEKNEYEKGFKLQEIFPVNVTGIVTMGDNFIICENLDELKNRLNYFINNEISVG